MKVLIYSNPNLLDCDLPLVRALQEKGIDVTYLLEVNANGTNSTLLTVKNGHKYNGIIPASSYPELSIFSKYIDINKFYLRNYYKKSKIPLLDAFVLSIKSFKFLKREHFDIIQRTQVYFFTDVILYFFRKRTIKIVHDPFPHSGNTMNGLTSLFYKIGMKLIPRFVVLNRSQYDRFCEVYNKDKEKVLLNCLGVYDCYTLFRKDEDAKQIKPNNVLFFGRVSKYKGIEYLCDAMPIVRQSIPDATVTIVGGGEYYFDITKYEKLGYYSFVNRYVTTSELSAFLTECSVVICPYTDSTQSGVVMTAFSHNKPVIASCVGGLAEQVDDMKSGILVPPKDSNALAKSIVKILQDSQLYKKMKDYINKEYYTGDRSWNSIAEKYINFYSDTEKR